MNFGILMVQGLINSFGATVMAAYAAAVKIASLAYTPSHEFGSAYSIFISQNLGAGKNERIKKGTKGAFIIGTFSVLVSILIFIFSSSLMGFFVAADETDVIRIGVGYLHTEGSFYIGIGILFLLYGYCRGIRRPEWSIILTVISLGTRVLLSYTLAPFFGEKAVWWSIVTGWLPADALGLYAIRKVQYKEGE